MRQLVYTMLVSNNRASFQLWWKESLIKHQKSQNIMKMIVDTLNSKMVSGRTPNHSGGSSVPFKYTADTYIPVCPKKSGHDTVSKGEREKPSSNQLEWPNSIHTKPAFQDGRFIVPESVVPGGRFHKQSEHDACILLCKTLLILTEICPIFNAREPCPVSSFLFWFRPSTSNILEPAPQKGL